MDETFKIRSRFLVNRDYQFRFIRMVLTQTLLTALLLISIFYLFQHNQMEFLNKLMLAPEQQKIMEQWSGSMLMRILGIVVLICVFQCLLALLFSHRVAGPIYRLKKYLGDISRGENPQQIQFRREDQVHDLQDAYNGMASVLEKERQNDLRIVLQMEEGLEHLKQLLRDEQSCQLLEYIERLNHDLKNLKTH